jgi:hypothetical protein
VRHVGIRPGPHPGGCARRRHGGRRELPGQSILPFATFPAAPKCTFSQCNSVESCNSTKNLTAKNAKTTETRPYGYSLRSLGSLWLIRPWLRLAALRLLRLFAANQFKCLSLNHLRLQTGFPVRGQSRPIKVNQGVFIATCAAPPGGAGSSTTSPTGQTRSNPVKPQKPALTGFDLGSESELTGFPESLRPEKGPDR